MIPRDLTSRLLEAASRLPLVTVTGPRQSGKTTLCRQSFPALSHVNLELPDVRAYAIGNPRAFLADHPGGAILDEIQRAPDLMSYLQDDGNGLELLEAKAGRTLDPRLAEGLRSAVEILGEGRVHSSRLVHGGDERRTVGAVEMIGWSAFD